jgi:GPH family glycoside/pentoside/hexuronide:cation symporter
MAYTIGSLLAVCAMYFLGVAESRGEHEVRELSFQLSVVASVVTAILIIYAVLRLPERKDFQGRVSESPLKAFKDVWQNHHARLALVVTFIEYIGSSVIGILTLYVTQYVVGQPPQVAAFIILSYMIPSATSVPIWLPLARRFGKIRLWMFSMMLTGLSFGGMFALPFIELELRLPLIFFLAIFAGFAAGCGGTISPSIQSDIIDYDEYKTGERKEGSYFAAFNFAQKSAIGVMIVITGFVLQFSGYVPNQDQTMTVQVAMVSLYGLLPLVCYSIGTYMFSRFSLDEAAYDKVRVAVDSRSAPMSSDP